MLRPATPLTILLLASFILLLLSVLSTPIIKGVPIANFKNVNFGVFGYCTLEDCSGPRIGYNTDDLFGTSKGATDFSLPSTARHSLSTLLVVHPIAALFNLVCLGLAGAAHLHSPSHSARYLLALLILLLPTLLVTLLAFLVDILLFVPHLQWGGWIVLASTILITASGVVTCAMRRTLVSRKARKKRIAENAEMSGENFYNRQNSMKLDATSQRTSDEPKPPLVNGAPGSDTLPTFVTYNKEQDISVERFDLGQRTPSTKMNGGPVGYRGSNGEALGPVRSRSQDQYKGARDDFESSLPSSGVMDAAPPNLRGPSDPDLRQRALRDRMDGPPGGPRGGFGYGGPRGRAGYPSRGSYGPPRGGMGGPRGGPNHAMSRGGYQDGRGSHYNRQIRGGAMAAGVGTGLAAGALTGRPQQGPPPGYPPQGQRVSPEGYGSQENLRRFPSQGYGAPGDLRQQYDGVQMRRPSPGPTPLLPQDAPFVGQAVEMNAATGRISQAASRPQDEEMVHDTVTMRPGQPSPGSQYSSPDGPSPLSNNGEPTGLTSPSSMYSHAPEGYVPPRAVWTKNSRTNSLQGSLSRPGPSPAGVSSESSSSNVHSTSSSGHVPVHNPTHRRSSSHYYEDVDPRFSEVHINATPLPDQEPTLPISLLPGGPSALNRQLAPRPGAGLLQPNPSDENLQDGARSPTGSETSHFTSVSQRGVNPRWRTGGEDMRGMPSGPPGPPSAMRRPVPANAGYGGPTRENRDVLLQGNPDFEVPGMGPPGRSGPLPGGVGRVPMQRPPPEMDMNGPVTGLTGAGRYPRP
ncbi:hypothetical protein GJ744_006196 [Endocarpon pusillum]|uniref:Pali-domain-containing protein n=1 Tax=Endocarpon pusillum TaxID=364733 RepID=A0A8H7ALX1_9EURO|nr:hypothetical protein GJ744_006196 [Endocarpon pusillum]